MVVEFSSKFSKDLDSIQHKSVKTNLANLIEFLESAKDITGVPNLKKLVGHKHAYRVRLGDFRVGFFYENKNILMARIVHRRDIYKVFP